MTGTVPDVTRQTYDWPIAHVTQTACLEYTVVVSHDDMVRGFDDVLYDQPVLVLRCDANTSTAHDSSSLDNTTAIGMILEDDLEGMVDEYLTDEDGEEYLDSEGQFETQAEYLLFRLDLGLTTFSVGGDSYALCWSRKEWADYAGKDATDPSTSELEAWMSGEVYGYEVFRTRDIAQDMGDGEIDVDFSAGDSVDSCWGFIGELDYCEREGLAEAEALAQYHRKAWTQWLKPRLKGRMPLEKRWAHALATKYSSEN